MRTNRRMRRTRVKTMYLRRRRVTKDGEGVPNISFGEPTEVKGEYWRASGKLQVETYGDRINNIYNVKIRGEYTISQRASHQEYNFGDFSLCEGDGLCIHVDSDQNPDYRIISITPYRPLRMEVEKI